MTSYWCSLSCGAEGHGQWHSQGIGHGSFADSVIYVHRRTDTKARIFVDTNALYIVTLSCRDGFQLIHFDES